MDLSASAPSDAPTLSLEQLQVLEQAKRDRRKLDRAAGVAAFNGWSLVAAAVITLPFALFGVSGLIAFAVLSATAWVEFQGRRGLKTLERKAPMQLMWNQLVLAGAITVYCGLQGWHAWTGSAYEQVIAENPELADILGDMDGMIRWMSVTAYAAIALGSWLMQGLTAWYYASRRKVMQRYLRDTPGWALDVLRRVG